MNSQATIVESRTTPANHAGDGGAIPASSLHFRTGRTDEAARMVLDYHYSKRLPSSVQMVGSLHLDGGLFGGDGLMVAACLFSIPPIAWREPVIELSRMVRGDSRVPLSLLISLCAKELRKRGHDLIVSFADRTHGHEGFVYRASNFNYHGLRNPRIDGVVVNGRLINQRQCRHLFGSSLSTVGVIERMRDGLPADVVPHWDKGKHLYWLALGKRGRQKAERMGLKDRDD